MPSTQSTTIKIPVRLIGPSIPPVRITLSFSGHVVQHGVALGIVTCGKVVRFLVLLLRQEWLFINATLALSFVEFVGKLLATRAEPAPGRWVGGVGDITLENDPPTRSLLARIGQRNGREQRLRVRMRG